MRSFKDCTNATIVKDEYPVTDGREFPRICRGENLHGSLCGEILHKFVNLGFGPYINATCWVVEQENRWLRFEPFGEDHLLLVPARQATHLLIDRRGVD